MGEDRFIEYYTTIVVVLSIFLIMLWIMVPISRFFGTRLSSPSRIIQILARTWVWFYTALVCIVFYFASNLVEVGVSAYPVESFMVSTIVLVLWIVGGLSSRP